MLILAGACVSFVFILEISLISFKWESLMELIHSWTITEIDTKISVAMQAIYLHAI